MKWQSQKSRKRPTRRKAADDKAAAAAKKSKPPAGPSMAALFEQDCDHTIAYGGICTYAFVGNSLMGLAGN